MLFRSEITIAGGPHAGRQGLVCRLPRDHTARPSVLLFLDADGRPMDAPIEVDLAREPDVEFAVADAA